MSSNKLNQPMFLFDADCGVCQNSTELMEKRINPPVDFRPYQSIDYASFGITTKNLSEGPILISTDGTFLIGPIGMATLLKMSRRPYSNMGRFMLLPGIRHFLNKVGPGLYAKRRYLPGATDSCAVNPE
jgi:hypothetical protein